MRFSKETDNFVMCSTDPGQRSDVTARGNGGPEFSHASFPAAGCLSSTLRCAGMPFSEFNVSLHSNDCALPSHSTIIDGNCSHANLVNSPGTKTLWWFSRYHRRVAQGRNVSPGVWKLSVGPFYGRSKNAPELVQMLADSLTC